MIKPTSLRSEKSPRILSSSRNQRGNKYRSTPSKSISL
nr:MAG TPA: hypothetical protein [Caudoviricetes sp.]